MLPGGMRDHTDCKYWNYDNHPDRLVGLPQRCASLTAEALSGQPTVNGSIFETRPDHAVMFAGMTPPWCACLLGNYRGTPDCPDLTQCRVEIPHDREVGIPPELVAAAMKDWEADCISIMLAYDAWIAGDGSSASLELRLKKFAVNAARAFERFLTIHPYIDGNGHCARLMLFRMMVWVGFPPRRWNIDAKLPLNEELSLHRRRQEPGRLRIALAKFFGTIL